MKKDTTHTENINAMTAPTTETPMKPNGQNGKPGFLLRATIKRDRHGNPDFSSLKIEFVYPSVDR